jgi:anti-anti-sigma factor
MLEIQPQPSATQTVQEFTLIGTIDIEAITPLESLYIVPSHSQIALDFALVQRVNSMGLAQLLKLFEHWKKQNVHIRVNNVNRMIGVLFKMTGLTRFLPDENTPHAPETAISETPSIATPPTAIAQSDSTGKLKLWVEAQNSHQMNGWYFFNTYLQRQLNRDIHLELVHGAISEQTSNIEQMDIVFTKPFEATRLLMRHYFRPLLHPIHQADEVTVLVRADEPRQKISEFNGSKVMVSQPESFVYLLGRFLLEEAGATNLEYSFSGHDIKALQNLLKGQADILFMLTDTYNGLSSLTRKMLRQIDQSQTDFAFHLFSAAPHCIEVGNAVAEVLLNMGQDSQGRQVLADLGMEGWSRPKQDEINMLIMLFSRYATVDKQRKAV